MSEIDPVSEMLGSFKTSIKDIQNDVTEIKRDVKSLVLWRAKVAIFGTLGGMAGGAITWTIVRHFASLL